MRHFVIYAVPVFIVLSFLNANAQLNDSSNLSNINDVMDTTRFIDSNIVSIDSSDISLQDSVSTIHDTLAENISNQSRIKKIYKSYINPDDTIIFLIRSWKYDIVTGSKKSADFDTNVFVNERYNPLTEKCFSNLYLGNLGSPGIANIFIDRTRSPFAFGAGYAPYLFNENSYFIYKTKRPFTLASFSYGDSKLKEERLFKILHTQNINENFNFGFKIRNIQSAGQYEGQKVFQNAMSLFSSYHTHKFKIDVALSRTMIKNDENGGIIDSIFENSTDEQEYEILYTNSVLRSPNTIYRNHNIIAGTEYSLIDFGIQKNDTTDQLSRTSLILGQFTSYDQHFRQFQVTILDDEFFGKEPILQNPDINDSAFYRSFNNKIYFKLRSGNQFITGGIENEFLKYAYKVVPDTTYITSNQNNGSVTIYEKSNIITDKSIKKFNSALYGDIEFNISHLLNLKFLGKYYLFGYQQNMVNLSGRATLNLSKNMIELSSALETRKPDYLYDNYISNFYEWHNSFKNTREWETEAIIRNKEKLTGIRLNYTLLSNWLYYNNDAIIDQLEEVTSIMTFKVFGEFDFWKFKTKNELAIQRTGNEKVLPLPAAAIYHSLNIHQKLFNDVLHINLGYDFQIYSEYYAYAYMPLTGVFYTQDVRKTGSYPFIDAYLSFKVKKTLFLFKYDHVTSGLFGRNFYTALHYPIPERVLHFGIKWIFLN